MEYCFTFDSTLRVRNSFKFRISASGDQISLIKLTSIGKESSGLLPAVKRFKRSMIIYQQIKYKFLSGIILRYFIEKSILVAI